MPSQLVYSRDPLVREVITSQQLHNLLSLDYLHAEVTACLSPALMQSLGIHSLSTQHLLEVGKVMVQRMADLDGEGTVGNDFLILKRPPFMQDAVIWLCGCRANWQICWIRNSSILRISGYWWVKRKFMKDFAVSVHDH